METKPDYTTNQTKALAVVPLTPSTWQMIEAVAPAMHAARFFGVSNPEQAMAIMLKGHELGLGLAASFDFMDAFANKVGLKPMGALALIHRSPLCAKVEIVEQPGSCTVTMERTNGFSYTLTWTMADAQQAGLVKPGGGWEKYPANMLRWRAVGFCADVVFPDVLGGMKRTDELGADLTEDGDTIIDTTWNVAPPKVVPAPRKVTWDYLLDNWTTEEIMAANGGSVPTEDQLEEIAAKLEDADLWKMPIEEKAEGA